MKRCNLCGKEHQGTCDRSQFDPIFSDKYSGIPKNIQDIVTYHGEIYKLGTHSQEVEKIEQEALADEEQNHINRKRGRPSRHG